MLSKEIEDVATRYDGMLKGIDERIRKLKVALETNHFKTVDLMHEADPRNHIVGLPRKRKVDSRVAMEIGLRLKALAMEYRDLKDELATLEVVRQQFPCGSKEEQAISNVARFISGGKSRKYARKAGGY